MPQFLCRLTPCRPGMLVDGPSADEARRVDEHFAWLHSLTEAGTVRMAGRTLNADAHSFGIVIFVAADAAAAQALMDADPAVRHGVMRSELFPFRVALWSATAPQNDDAPKTATQP